MSDVGLYECQISTTPIMRHQVFLQVAGNMGTALSWCFWCFLSSDPYTEIVGGPNIDIEKGSTKTLTCLVRESPEPPHFFFWYKDEQVKWYYLFKPEYKKECIHWFFLNSISKSSYQYDILNINATINIT